LRSKACRSRCRGRFRYGYENCIVDEGKVDRTEIIKNCVGTYSRARVSEELGNFRRKKLKR